MNLTEYYFATLNNRRAELHKNAAFQPGKPKQPLTAWQRISKSFGTGAIQGGIMGSGIGLGILASNNIRGDTSANNPLGITGLMGVGGAIGGVLGGTKQVIEDEINRRINIEAKRKILQARAYEEMSGGEPSSAMNIAATGIPAPAIAGLPPMGFAVR